MTPQLERLTVLCKQLNLLHLPTQIAHLGQMAAKRELVTHTSYRFLATRPGSRKNGRPA